MLNPIYARIVIFAVFDAFDIMLIVLLPN